MRNYILPVECFDLRWIEMVIMQELNMRNGSGNLVEVDCLNTFRAMVDDSY